jgi:hypothetical protein
MYSASFAGSRMMMCRMNGVILPAGAHLRDLPLVLAVVERRRRVDVEGRVELRLDAEEVARVARCGPAGRPASRSMRLE